MRDVAQSTANFSSFPGESCHYGTFIVVGETVESLILLNLCLSCLSESNVYVFEIFWLMLTIVSLEM